MVALLTEAATELLGKQALLRRLADAYSSAGGDGVATVEAVEAAIKLGVNEHKKAYGLRYATLKRAFGEVTGGRKPSMEDLAAAIHRGAR